MTSGTASKKSFVTKKKKKKKRTEETVRVLQEQAFHSVTPAVKRCNEADFVLLLLFVAGLRVATGAV